LLFKLEIKVLSALGGWEGKLYFNTPGDRMLGKEGGLVRPFKNAVLSNDNLLRTPGEYDVS